MISMLATNLSNDILIFLSYFSQKTVDFPCKLGDNLCEMFKPIFFFFFFLISKRNIINLSSSEFIYGVVKAKALANRFCLMRNVIERPLCHMRKAKVQEHAHPCIPVWTFSVRRHKGEVSKLIRPHHENIPI